MKRVIALITFFFLFLTTLESWAGFWLLGRWYVSSRYATVSLGTVKSWLDRRIINRGTEWAKIFIQKNGKWILLTIGLSQVIPEVERLRTSSSACYVGQTSVRCYVGTPTNYFCYGTRSTRDYFSMFPELEGSTCGFERDIPGHFVYVWRDAYNSWVRLADQIPAEGRHFIGRNFSGNACYLNVSILIPPCPFSDASSTVVSGHPPRVNWQERRGVPVRVFPNVDDFLRDDVIAIDPALQWLRDEYQRLSQDASIPTIPADALGDLTLPEVDWFISPEEALDYASESSLPLGREGEGSREGDISIPGLDTKLDPVQRKAFPVELINSLVQNHPLLRTIQGINFDFGSGGSCRIGSGVFTVDFCDHAWIFNLMGAIIVPIAFIVGLFGWRND